MDDRESNDTLSNHGCDAHSDNPRHAALQVWADHAGAGASTRLNRLAPGSNLTAFDFIELASLCPLEKAARHFSPFCAVFEKEDWIAFEHYFDIQKYFFTGSGA